MIPLHSFNSTNATIPSTRVALDNGLKVPSLIPTQCRKRTAQRSGPRCDGLLAQESDKNHDVRSCQPSDAQLIQRGSSRTGLFSWEGLSASGCTLRLRLRKVLIIGPLQKNKTKNNKAELCVMHTKGNKHGFACSATVWWELWKCAQTCCSMDSRRGR